VSQIANVLTELDMEAIADVREFVMQAHSGQMRRGDTEPYHQHAWRVGEAVQARRGMSMDAILAAYMHDVIEDTDIVPLKLLELGYSERTVQLVMALSRDADIPYSVYIDDLAASGDVELMTIKLADLNDNSIIWPEGCWVGWEHAMSRYNKAKVVLMNAILKSPGYVTRIDTTQP